MKFLASLILALFSLAAFAADYFPRQVTPFGQPTFVFSPAYHQWAAYDEEGFRVAHGIANGGSEQCPTKPMEACETPVGTFKIIRKGNENCASKQYFTDYGEPSPMPYCMFFNSAGEAIHGSDYISNHNRSHGCIRVKTASAKWLSEYFLMKGTQVVVLPYARNQDPQDIPDSV